eukprot:355366-Chlamydomonas_euryale.AAC.2
MDMRVDGWTGGSVGGQMGGWTYGQGGGGPRLTPLAAHHTGWPDRAEEWGHVCVYVCVCVCAPLTTLGGPTALKSGGHSCASVLRATDTTTSAYCGNCRTSAAALDSSGDTRCDSSGGAPAPDARHAARLSVDSPGGVRPS